MDNDCALEMNNLNQYGCWARGFPFSEEATAMENLTYLDLLDNEGPLCCDDPQPDLAFKV
jgi:hypothetical protein